jgi:hypothetical protein
MARRFGPKFRKNTRFWTAAGPRLWRRFAPAWTELSNWLPRSKRTGQLFPARADHLCGSIRQLGASLQPGASSCAAWSGSASARPSRRRPEARAAHPGHTAGEMKETRARVTQPPFSREALRLFARLEATPQRRRHSAQFRDDEKHLMCHMLDLGDEFWMMQSPLDRSRQPCHPPHCAAFSAWHLCHTVREQLLEATGLSKKNPAKARRGTKAEDEDAQPSHKVASHASSRTN